MRANANLFWIIAVFFFLADIVYTVWHVIYAQANGAQTVGEMVEWVGTVAIGLTGVLGVLIAFYLTKATRAIGGVLPEDRLDADIDDGDAEQGFFSPWSWWPVFLGAGAALVFLGLAIGFWIAIIGVPLALIGVVGWVYEYYRGYFSR
jgi:hypothetical protein